MAILLPVAISVADVISVYMHHFNPIILLLNIIVPSIDRISRSTVFNVIRSREIDMTINDYYMYSPCTQSLLKHFVGGTAMGTRL